MDHEQSGKLSGRFRGSNEISANASIAMWRRDGDILGLETTVILGHLLRESIVRSQRLPESHRGEAAGCVLLRGVEKIAAAHLAMNVVVKDVQQLLWEIGRFLSCHSSLFPRYGPPGT